MFAKHIALGAIDWLKKRGIQPERDGKFEPIEPVVRSDQRNASVYFSDPDGHRLELLCTVPGDAPEDLPKTYWSEWEKQRKK